VNRTKSGGAPPLVRVAAGPGGSSHHLLNFTKLNLNLTEFLVKFRVGVCTLVDKGVKHEHRPTDEPRHAQPYA
jgi:hypothetical protein